MKTKIFLLLILIFGFGLRFYKLDQNPPSLSENEVFIGYNAYSIIKTARDQQGNFLPLLISFNNQIKLPGYIYLTLIPVWLLGPAEISVRLISLISGLGLILIGYIITKQLTENDEVSLFSAFLAAVSPWSLFMSRTGLATNLSALFISLGVLIWLKKENWLSFIFWGLSLYTDIVSWFFFPIIIFYPIIFLIKKKKWKNLILSLFISLVSAGPLIYQLILSKLTTTFLNIPTKSLNLFIINYLKYFNLKTIFFNRGDLYQFSVPGQGILFLTSAPFIIIGLFMLIKKARWLLVIWLLAGFIPASLWFRGINWGSSLIILPLPMILTGLGLNKTIKFLQSKSKFGGKLVLIVLILTIFVELGMWWRDYWQIYLKNYSWAWQFGYKQTISYAKENYSKYNSIVFTKKYGLAKDHLLFYWPWQPSYIQSEPQGSDDGFDKFKFYEDWEVIEKTEELKNSNKRILLITSPNNYPQGGDLIKTIDFLDGQPAFQIVRYEQTD